MVFIKTCLNVDSYKILSDRYKYLISQIDVQLTDELYREPGAKFAKIIISCKYCDNRKELKPRSLEFLLRRNAHFCCRSCASTKSHERNLDLKNKISVSVKIKCSEPGYRESQIQRQNTDEYVSAAKERSKLNWENGDYRDRQKTAKNDPEHRKIQSNKSKEKWKDQLYVDKQKTSRQTPEFKNKMALLRSKQSMNGRDSSLEVMTHNILSSMNVKWEKQYVIGPWSFDVFVPSHNLLIECQGEYWYSLEGRQAKDRSKFTYTNEYFPQYNILYLYHRDFLNPDAVLQKLSNALFKTGFEQTDFNFKDLSTRPLYVQDKLTNSRYSASEEFLQSFHYAGYGRAAKKVYGAFLENKLVAVCKFAGVVRNEVASSMGLEYSKVLELDRFCIHPQFHKKNFASWFISRCSRFIFDEFPKITRLVSFADSTYGHSGVIYKAANWTEVGKVKPDYYYATPDGWIMKKKRLYGHARSLRKTELEYAEENNYVKVFGKEKTKFILNR